MEAQWANKTFGCIESPLDCQSKIFLIINRRQSLPEELRLAHEKYILKEKANTRLKEKENRKEKEKDRDN